MTIRRGSPYRAWLTVERGAAGAPRPTGSCVTESGWTAAVSGWTSIRRAASPEVDPHRGSFLGRSIAGRSGPIWSLAAWNAVLAVVSLLNAVALVVSGGDAASRVGVACYWTIAAAAVWWWRGLRGWAVHLVVDVNIVLICAVAATAVNDVRATSMLMFMVVAAVYCATWMPRTQMALHFLLIAIGTAWVVTGFAVPYDSARIWVVLMSVTVGVGYFVNYLVQHLNQQVYVDPLTGLMNRAGLASVADAHARVGASGDPRIVVVIDLDGFKGVNDRFGHAAGDDLLREVGSQMAKHLRPRDVVTRMGGDEFVLILGSADEAVAAAVVERLVAALPIACSTGLSAWAPGEAFEDALSRADAAMYADKVAKKGDRRPPASTPQQR